MLRTHLKKFQYEHRSKPLLSRSEFLTRFGAHFTVVILIIGVSLAGGMICYHTLADLSWIDALLNASMILGGEGPVDPMPNDASKLFASIYALYSGLILLVSVGILFAPVLHRILHKFHLLNSKGE